MMTLNVQIDAADLPVILAAQERIVLVKNIRAGLAVAWVATAPMQQAVLSWDDGYSLYASSSPGQVGGQLTMMATTPAIGGCAYPFSSNGFGNGASQAGLSQIQYRIDNGVAASTSPGLLFGLAQPISINNNVSTQLMPLNAEVVPAMQSTVQTATDSVTIWLQSGVAPGQIVTMPSGFSMFSMSGPLVVPFSGVTTQNVLYSSLSGRFEIVS